MPVLRKLGVWRSLGVALATFPTACFSYVPTEPAAVPEGREVRVYVGREALVELADQGQTSSPFVSGTLMRRESDRLLLRVPVAARRRGFTVESLGQDVFIRNDQVVMLERREVNRLGTGLLTLGGTAVVGGLIFMIIDGALQGERAPVPGDVEARTPLILQWR